ncbi:MAG: CheR family methyltransferase [Methylococcaceae bacterium]
MDLGAALVEWLSRDFGLDSAVFGDETIQSAVMTRQRLLGLTDHHDYFKRWRIDPLEQSALLEALLVGETWFFREPAAFNLLAEWLQRHRGRAPLRILTLPCATGEEAWSIAAVLKSLGFEPDEAQIEAMDISVAAIETAQRGLYPAKRLRLSGAEPWYHQLTPKDGLITIDCELKAMVRFTTVNAADRESILQCCPYDVIFCRNMLIYMHDRARLTVLQTLLMRLQPEGLLFLGHAERPAPELGLVRATREGTFAWQRSTKAAAQPSPSLGHRQRILPGVKRTEPILAHAKKRLSASTCSAPPGDFGPQEIFEEHVLWKEAIALADQGRLEEAYERVGALELKHEMNPDLQCFAGVLLGALGRVSEAMTRFRRALYLNPQHSESLLHLRLLLEEKGEHEAAERLKSRWTDS